MASATLDETLQNIGANIRRARLRRELTQAELAQLAEQDLSYVQRVERGVTNVTIGVLLMLANALAVPLTSLLKKSSPLPRPTGRPRRRRPRPG